MIGKLIQTHSVFYQKRFEFRFASLKTSEASA